MSGDFESSRRRFLALSGLAATGAAAGCLGLGGDSDDTYDPSEATMNEFSLGSFQGSGAFVGGRPAPDGTSINDLPNLAGKIGVFLGGGEGGLYTALFEKLEAIYPDFEVSTQTKPSSQIANQIIEENKANQIQADVFLAVDAGSLGTVADAGATESLTSTAVDSVPETFQGTDRSWVGVAGRARSIPYNTDQLSASDVPASVADFPSTEAFQGSLGWAPTYSAFQSFITAMRLIRGESETKQWLNDMQSANVTRYDDEFRVSQAVADGEILAGFANHYYALRVQAWNDDPPIDLAFTSGDAGSLVNVSGAALLKGTNKSKLATNFIRHLLSAEAQEFFATQTYAYPMIPGVQPVGGLPTIDDLDTPDIDLTKLSETGPTLDLMRETGVL